MAKPSHKAPTERSNFEKRMGLTYCRRCGCLLVADRKPGLKPKATCTPTRIRI